MTLARILASKSNSVILISTSRTVPMLKVLVPSQRIDKTHSLGGLFLSSSFNQEDVCKKIVFPPHCENLGIMGMATGDTPNTYSGIILRERVIQLLSILSGLADFIIVDCMSNVSQSNDPLGNAALSIANLIIETLTADAMGIEYRSAMHPIVAEAKESRPNITVLSNYTPQHPLKEIESLIPEVKYNLPKSAEIQEFLLSGSFHNPKTNEGLVYVSGASIIVKEEII